MFAAAVVELFFQACEARAGAYSDRERLRERQRLNAQVVREKASPTLELTQGLHTLPVHYKQRQKIPHRALPVRVERKHPPRKRDAIFETARTSVGADKLDRDPGELRV